MATILFFVGVVAYILFKFNTNVREGVGYADRKAAPLKSKVLPIPGKVKDILERYFTYYNKLSPDDKNRFARKVVLFLYGKRFIPRNVSEVTIEAKVLIAASAVQLTFGLPDIYLKHFDKILVYPNDYYSSITKRYHKGEVNPRFGMIVLSWQSFIDGYINPTDSLNLGLHEMAHALRLENIIRNEEFHFFDEDLMEKFDEYARSACDIMAHEEKPFLRPYACTNAHEFFSVAVENFFERPLGLRQALPDIYNILSKLLNQNPALLAGNEPVK
jgi:Mlc titration factor MtfA (ptsG expression regulator)